MKQWIERWRERVRGLKQVAAGMPLEADERLCFVID